MAQYKFSEGFMWGGASSAVQSEGTFAGDGKVANQWDYFYEKSPERFYGEIGPEITSNFYNNYKEIIKAMKDAGVKSYRTSLQWSRICTDKEGTINQVGVDFYHKMLDELLANGIEPMLCLHHFDTPMFMLNQGGFENRDTAVAFAIYAQKCFSLFGDKVKYWSTFNEPVVVPHQSYILGGHYPGICDMKKAVQVAYHLQLASAMAIQAFKEKNTKGQIGIILNLTPTYTENPDNPGDVRAGEICDLLHNRSFLDPSVLGEYPKALCDFIAQEGLTPQILPEDLQTVKENTVQYLGVNYYHPRRVRARAEKLSGPQTPESYYEEYVPKEAKFNFSRGWEIYAPAIYDIAINLRDNYGNIPWYISENGMGVMDEEQFMNEQGIVQDDYRIEFISDHLAQLHKGIKAGSNCFGYHLWAPFDCWSWTNAYKNRYGLIRIDIYDDCKVSLKKSAGWFKTLSEKNEFEA